MAATENENEMENGTGGALDQALTALECVAVEPGIGPVLFVDLDPALLRVFANVLGDMVGGLYPEPGVPDVHVLGPWADAEALRMRLRSIDGRIVVAPGPLAEVPGRPPPVLAIPHLGSVGLSVVQALLTQVGAEAYQSAANWLPQAWWLAAADQRDLATMSPHLLDRFAVRFDGRPINAALLRVAVAAGGKAPATMPTPHELVERARANRAPLEPVARPAAWSLEANQAVMRALTPEVGRRRDLALAHSARALATRQGAATVRPGHVSAAARLLGLKPVAPSLESLEHHADLADASSAPEHAGPAVSAASSAAATPAAAGSSVQPTGVSTHKETVEAPAPPVDFDALPTSAAPVSRTAESLFPERGPDALPPLSSLREARRGTARGARLRGPAVGDKALDLPSGLNDIALSATMVRASMRRSALAATADNAASGGEEPSSRPDVHPTDLRQHRRSPRARAALVLVLDHSCLAGWAWRAALAPHLQWAYRTSAAVTLIECGHRDAPNEFAAHRTRARSLADPSVVRALSQLEPGRATPLAHALDLAAMELRRWARTGSGAQIRLVVATDGRGNIPLSASGRGRAPSAPVHREGVEDGLRAAEAIRGLAPAQVRRHVVGPETDQYPELLFELADRLGAELRRSPASLGGG